eukprot:TRINITY_DN463_c0_g1_i1.p1 TRINITY_DN463_c0_g1~~TRINITY_DN463_c0_g1_i1.p1  ORF type:complete len:235 (+),score=58.91 TRINITY_DN463_c0_g1_i1:41-706(+)
MAFPLTSSFVFSRLTKASKVSPSSFPRPTKPIHTPILNVPRRGLVFAPKTPLNASNHTTLPFLFQTFKPKIQSTLLSSQKDSRPPSKEPKTQFLPYSSCVTAIKPHKTFQYAFVAGVALSAVGTPWSFAVLLEAPLITLFNVAIFTGQIFLSTFLVCLYAFRNHPNASGFILYENVDLAAITNNSSVLYDELMPGGILGLKIACAVLVLFIIFLFSCLVGV